MRDDVVRVVIAPDSFKEGLTSPEVAAALERGWLQADPGASCRRVPLADGGEGTVEALVAATSGRLERREVTGPDGTTVTAAFGVLGGDGPATAVVEVAAASGIGLVPAEHRDAARATSYGTGQLLAAALDLGVRRVVLGLGGSACTDGGVGLAQALGIRFLDAAGEEVGPGGAELARIATLDAAGVHPALAACELVAACDVDNPLSGPDGAAAVFGPQKGADTAAVALLDDALRHLAGVVVADGGRADDTTLPGAGAAGGIGYAVVALLGGTLRPGFEIVADAVGLDALLDDADVVLTGEGRLDAQSLAGKAPVGVMRRAVARGLPVVAVGGSLGSGAADLVDGGMTAVLSISPGAVSLDEALSGAVANLEHAGRTIGALWAAAAAGRDLTGR